MRRCSPNSTSERSSDSPDRDVHLTARTGSRDPRHHRFDAVVAAFVAACRAEVLSERTIEFYLEALNSYRAFAGAGERDLTLADVDLGIARAWLADFVERKRKPATVAARARAVRVFSGSTALQRALSIIATAIVVAFALWSAFWAPQTFGGGGPNVWWELSNNVALFVLAAAIAAIGLIWTICIFRGPRDEPPEWRNRDR